MVRNFIIAILALSEMSCASGGHRMNEKANVGYAEMTSDGVITLHLIGKTDSGIIAHAVETHRPSDPEYEEIIQHIGGMKPGEKKAVPPWPDK